MPIKYVPVLRWRDEEKDAISSVTLSDKTLPMVEIIREKRRYNMRGTFAETYTAELGELHHPVIVDFPSYVRFYTRTSGYISRFLRPLIADPMRRVERFSQLAGIAGMIPTVTYNPRDPNYRNARLREQAQALREDFDSLAFRVFAKHRKQAAVDIAALATANDTVIFDLDFTHHRDPSIMPDYELYRQIKNNTNCRLVLIRSALPSDVSNNRFSAAGAPIPGADNSLLRDYAGLGYDAFGDYAGVKKDRLTGGGQLSPGLSYYDWPTNQYIGFRGVYANGTVSLDAFRDVIVPAVLASTYYTGLSNTHRDHCPGCKEIRDVRNGTSDGRTQAMWKGVAMAHYLYSMEEHL